MTSQNEDLSFRAKVIEVLSQSLGLIPTDLELATLLKGEALSVEQLMNSHSLTEIGTLFIKLDALLQVNGNDQESSASSLLPMNSVMNEPSEARLTQKCDCPDGCRCRQVWPLCIKHCGSRPPDFRLSL
jgi:hypothetical protein